MLFGEMDNATNLKAICVHKFTKGLKVRSDIQTQKSEFSVVQLMTEYMGTDFSFCSTLVNPSLYPVTGVLALQYLQRVTQHLSLGADFTYQREALMQGAGLSGFVGYKRPGWQTFAKVSLGSWSVGYLRKVTENINLIGELEKLESENQREEIAGGVPSSGRRAGPEEGDELTSLESHVWSRYERFIGDPTASGEGEAAETAESWIVSCSEALLSDGIIESNITSSIELNTVNNSTGDINTLYY